MSLASWIFVPLTAQYLVGAALAFSVALFILIKNPKSTSYRYFSLYGLVVGFWMVTTFLHRNAPDSALSSELVTFSFAFGLLGVSFLFATLASLLKKRAVFIYVLPALALAVLTVFIKPLGAVMTDFGWSYVYTSELFSIIFVIGGFPYLAGIFIAGWSLIKKSETDALRKKYKLFLLGFVIFYMVCLSASNLMLNYNLNFPPLGGIFIGTTFALVAYAIIL